MVRIQKSFEPRWFQCLLERNFCLSQSHFCFDFRSWIGTAQPIITWNQNIWWIVLYFLMILKVKNFRNKITLDPQNLALTVLFWAALWKFKFLYSNGGNFQIAPNNYILSDPDLGILEMLLLKNCYICTLRSWDALFWDQKKSL